MQATAWGYYVMAAVHSPLPEAFRAPRLLRWLNVLAVGLSLAAATGLVLGTFMRAEVALASSATTLCFGLVWARVVRARRGSTPWGWLAAVPLAAMNAGTAFCIDRIVDQGFRPPFGEAVRWFLEGATFGVIVWGPALVVTLAIFGLPLYKAQLAADQGLGSEDRGERFVGAVAGAIAGLALVALPFAANAVVSRPPTDGWEGPLELAAPLPVGWLATIAACGLGAGLAAVVYATRRERARRRFVVGVERGAESGYQIESQPDGASLLVRVSGTEAGYYRAPRFMEPVVELDPHGEAKRTLERF